MRFATLLLLSLAAILLIGCSEGDDETFPTTTPLLSRPSPIVSSDMATSPSAAIVVSTLPPTLAPSPTPSLPYPVALYAGEWVLNLRYEITGIGGPDPTVDEWVYTGSAPFIITEYGEVSGSGILWPTPDDAQCIVSFLDYETGLPFAVEGQLRLEGQQVVLDVELNPGNGFFFVETYNILCPDDIDGPRQVSSNYFWPMLSQIDAMTYTFSVETGQDVRTIDMDLAERTQSSLRGQFHAELILRR